MNIKQLEKDLWESADDLRANSKLTATEYAQPVLGLIFLSHATARFYKLVQHLETNDPALRQMAEKIKHEPDFPADFYENSLKEKFLIQKALYLEPEQRFDVLAKKAGDQNMGQLLDDIMQAIEAAYPVLVDALPKTYKRFEPEQLQRLIRIFSRPALANASGDVFGKIYEYFLNKFAMSGAQEGGEFFTPPSLVKTIVNFIEPNHGVVFDPACGSAGMFVQTTHFLEDHQLTDTKIRFAGQEKSENNKHLAVMNMVVHGMDATNTLLGNTFYDRREELIGQCDFVMANPPFNVDAVDALRCEVDVVDLPSPTKEQPDIPIPTALDYMQAAVTEKKRLPFGLSGVTKRKSTRDDRADGGADKSGVVSNANSLWIQYFYSYLNATGRAGFVMASSASDAGGRDREIRQKLVETGHVDVMVSIGTKFFYTRSLPCTLWFFDKGKPESRLDQVLMLDARSVYTVVSAKSHVFSDAQLAALTAIVWLNRGEHSKYTQLLAGYLQDIIQAIEALPTLVAVSSQACRELAAYLSHFAKQVELAELNNLKPKKDKEGNPLPLPPLITQAELATYQADIENAYTSLGKLPTDFVTPSNPKRAKSQEQKAAIAPAQLELVSTTDSAPAEETAKTLVEPLQGLYAPLLALAQELQQRLQTDSLTHSAVVTAFTVAQAQQATMEAVKTAILERHQSWLTRVEQGLALRANLSKHWINQSIKAAQQPLQASAADARDDEITIHDRLLANFTQMQQRLVDIEWLQTRFPQGTYEDVLGLCKRVSRAEITANDYSLTAGRYVGVAEVEDDLEDFAERMRVIHQELADLDQQAAALGQAIDASFRELLG